LLPVRGVGAGYGDDVAAGIPGGLHDGEAAAVGLLTGPGDGVAVGVAGEQAALVGDDEEAVDAAGGGGEGGRARGDGGGKAVTRGGGSVEVLCKDRGIEITEGAGDCV
jgi:hypothetical protein